MNSRPVYLDNQATTPMDPSVREAMWPWLREQFGNPHSSDHGFGWEASRAVGEARARVAQLVNADDEEIVFTSGATESCNLALRGVAGREGNDGRNRIVTVATEHPAVLETVQDLGRWGFDSVVLPVGANGLVDLPELERATDERTLLVSVMAVNNEIGVVQPLTEIGKRCREIGALFHTDATQAVGRLEIDVEEWHVDLLSISGHKVYGPKGVGALFVRSGVDLRPVITGGGQERGLRGGTVPVPLAVGLGEASRMAAEKRVDDCERMGRLAGRLYEALLDVRPDIRLFGDVDKRIAGNLSIGFPGVLAEEIIAAVSDRLAVSSGSACSSGRLEPSRVLLALGLDEETAATGIRISLGRFTTDEDIDEAVSVLTKSKIIARRI